MRGRIIALLFPTLFVLCVAEAQAPKEPFSNWMKARDGFKIEPFLMFQFWGVHSMGEERYNATSKRYEPVDDRINVQVRRARFGFRAQPTDDLRFTAVAAFDGIGRDALTGTVGGANDVGPASVGILDAFMEWRMLPKREALFLVAGYFRPQFSRESITGAWVLSTIEKSMSQNYIRRHLTNSGLGRTFGINMGGVSREKDSKVGFTYNVGLFTPQYTGTGGITMGTVFAPLWVGRFALELGDPEMQRYGIAYDANFYGRRKGITLALNGAHQGRTDQFTSNTAFAGDILFNWKAFNLDAEYNWLWRDGLIGGTERHTSSTTGHLRSSYNVVFGKKYFLEPTMMIMVFNGPLGLAEQMEASALKTSFGKEKTYDVGINWHLQPKKLKVLLHYTWRLGDAGASGDGSQANMFFTESGIGAIKRGNWLGVGLHASI